MPTTRVAPFHERLAKARKDAGLSLIDVDFHIRGLLPEPSRISYASVNRWEQGKIAEEDIEPWILAALARIYGVPLMELSELAARRIPAYLDLVEEEAGPKPARRARRATSSYAEGVADQVFQQAA